ncbi:VWA domain-containing protein [Nocardia sp. NPDC005366]|uniref:VWA domain-containing protein n=1 Tax=Nocardia sp. NPDC005366 TaxID=3156878 RepID=UPI0033A23014
MLFLDVEEVSRRVGVYGLLRTLGTMDGRVVDNAGFFAVDDIDRIGDDDLYQRLLGEFRTGFGLLALALRLCDQNRADLPLPRVEGVRSQCCSGIGTTDFRFSSSGQAAVVRCCWTTAA